MDFKDYLKKNAKKVEKELNKILINFLKETKKTNPKLLPFAQKFVNSCKGGKRIRGVLVKLGYEIAQGVILRSKVEGYNNYILRSTQNDSKEIYKVSAAFEILHTSLLIHDDIIDKSLTRRNMASLYVSLGNNHYGISQAITLGDIGLYLPIKIIIESKFKDEIKIKALNSFSQILIHTGWGQVMDVVQQSSTSEESKPTFEVTEFINLFKTAKYTIAGPLQIGAIIGGSDNKLIKNLGLFGENLGIAFQLKDDILDGEAKGDSAQLKLLEYTAEARSQISKITKDEKMKELLNNMCEYLVERTI